MGARGKLITLEGIDGTGKSTQAGRLASWLQERGQRVRLLREPGGTALGEELRRLLKAGAVHAPVAELLLFCAARAELVQQEIRPALEAGEWVVLDRFVHSTLAYQGALGAVDLGQIEAIAALSAQGVTPDLALWLDLPVELAYERIGGLERDAFERRGEGYLEEVRRIYARLAALGALDPIDGSAAPDEVWEEIQGLVEARLGRA